MMGHARNEIGLIGLGVMGRNLVLNMADRGFRVGVYNRTESVTAEFLSQLSPDQHVSGAFSVEDLLDGLESPRKIMLMVSAQGVDAVIDELTPLLHSGDIVIDGGNSHFADTDRRAAALAAQEVQYLGVGISGGESGARHGPSMMPGGQPEAYEAVRPLFEAVAAKAGGRACVGYLGSGSAGHYVKMVHNGIEYALMQLIAESYAVLKQGFGLSNDRLGEVFGEWSEAELSSYLMEITAQIFRHRDPETGADLIDVILGEAGQKGTGMWASESAMDLHVPVPNIDIAVSMRNLSASESERQKMCQALVETGLGSASAIATSDLDSASGVERMHAALYAATIVSYGQGFAQLDRASQTHEYSLDLSEVSSIWRGGCIIRSALLRDITAAFERLPGLTNLLVDPQLGGQVAKRRTELAEVVSAAMSTGIPVPGLATALGYVDACAARWLPMNLIQAQRDLFGAHTYRRVDRDGTFHTDWYGEDG